MGAWDFFVRGTVIFSEVNGTYILTYELRLV